MLEYYYTAGKGYWLESTYRSLKELKASGAKVRKLVDVDPESSKYTYYIAQSITKTHVLYRVRKEK